MFGIVRNAWLDELRARGRRALFAPAESGEQVGDASQGAHATCSRYRTRWRACPRSSVPRSRWY